MESVKDKESLLEEFLSVFDSKDRSRVVEYAKHISDLKADVLVLMARKAACFYRCLETVGLVANSSIVTTDRIIAHDATWLKGLKVILIDDSIISGTSLFRTKEQLEERGCTVIVSTFFINKRWWASKLLVPDDNLFSFEDEDASRLSAKIVEAMSIIPRPYSVDYPLYENSFISASNHEVLQAIPGWICFDVSTSLQRSFGAFSITVQPNAQRLEQFDNTIGWPVSTRSLCKIRIYGRHLKNRVTFNILPIVAFGPITRTEIERLYTALLNAYSAHNMITDSFISGTSKIRLLQFYLAKRLGDMWLKGVGCLAYSDQVNYKIQNQEVELLFPPNIAQHILALCEIYESVFLGIPAEATRFADRKPKSLKSLNSMYDVQVRLINPFKKLYLEKELTARKIVQELGSDVFQNKSYLILINRLRDGLSVPDLVSLLPEEDGFDREFMVSNFLDISIDRGAVVPITAKTCSPRGSSSDIYYRAYRHGEEIIVTLREEKLAAIMLDAFLKTSGRSAIPNTWLEKLLVVFLRSGVYSGFLNPYYGQLYDPKVLGVTNHIYGAVTSVKLKSLYEFDISNSFSRMLLGNGVISRPRGKLRGYTLTKIPDASVEVKDENRAKKLGRRLGELDRATKQVEQNNTALFDLEAITLVATCLSPEHTICALAAELNIFQEFWITAHERWNLVNEGEAKLLASQLRKKDSNAGRAFVAINNGRWKYNSFKRGLPKQILQKATNYLFSLDEEKGESWQEFWPGTKEVNDTEEYAQINNYLKQTGEIILSINILIRSWECVINKKKNGPSDNSYDFADIFTLLTEMQPGIDRSRMASVVGIVERNFKQGDDNDVGSKLYTELWRLVDLSKGILGFVKRVIEPIGRLKMMTYFPSVMTVRLSTKNINHSQEAFLLNIVYETVDQINVRLKKNVAPQMQNQKYRALDVGSTSERLIKVNEHQWGSGVLQIAGKGNGIWFWLCYLSERILSKFSDSLSGLTITIFDDLPRYRQLFMVDGENQLDNPEFFEFSEKLKHVETDAGEGIYLCQMTGMNLEEKSEYLKETFKIKLIEDIKDGLVIDTLAPEQISLRHYYFKHRREGYMPEKYDIGIVVITPRELNGVQNYLTSEGGFKRASGRASSRTYIRKTLQLSDGKGVSMLITRAIEQGQQSVVSAANALAREAKPKIMVLLGIAGAIDDKLDLGDVVFGQTVIFYEDRVEFDRKTVRRLNSKSVPAWTLDKLGLFFSDNSDLACFNGLDGSPFKVTQAPIGSGEAIVKANRSEIKKYLMSLDYRTAAVEKEAMGFLQYYFEQELEKESELEGVLILRGISDKADAEKDDTYQVKAAENCMIALKHFLESIGDL